MTRTRSRSSNGLRLVVLAAVGAGALFFAGDAMAQSRKDRGWGSPPTIPPPTAAKTNFVQVLTAVGLGLGMVGVNFIGSKRTHQD